MADLDIQTVALDTLSPHPRNPNNGDVDAIAESIRTNGLYRPLVVQRSTGYVLAGNHTFAALLSLGHTTAPAALLDCDDRAAVRIMLADNRIADLAVIDDGLLAELLAELEDYAGTGYDEASVKDITDSLRAAEHTPLDQGPSLADRFLIPPFTVLDARQGWWRARKREWVALGIASEVGREHVSIGDTPAEPTTKRKATTAAYAQASDIGRANPEARRRTLQQGLVAHRNPDGTLGYDEMPTGSAVSIFDPVLCEIAYRWYCPPAGRVLDPYAGGSVRGIVAARLGLDYTGCELRPEQIAANEQQAAALLTPAEQNRVRWHEGDCADTIPDLPGGYDLAFTCPPYYDLEEYSGGDPRDLSSLDTATFDRVYGEHLQAVHDALAPDAYCVYVVGSAREGKTGRLRDLRATTVHAAQRAGFHLLSDAVLITPAGSLPVRAGRQFTATRVLGRTHQDVLIFWKGDRRRAATRLGEVDPTDALAGVLTDEQEQE